MSDNDMRLMRNELAELDPCMLLANLREAAPLAAMVYCGNVGPQGAGVRIGASETIIEEYRDKPVVQWPKMLVGMTWASAQDDLIPF